MKPSKSSEHRPFSFPLGARPASGAESGGDSFLARLLARLERGEAGDDVAIVYRVRGYLGERRVDDSVILRPSGSVRVRVRGETDAESEGLYRVGQRDILELCRLLSRSFPRLVPESEADFAPGALAASVTLVADGVEETFYFPTGDLS